MEQSAVQREHHRVDALHIAHAQAERLFALAGAGHPNEVCGVLIGSPVSPNPDDAAAVWRVLAAVPVANIAPQPDVHFHLDPHGLISAWADAEARGLHVVGFWHSHPAGQPIPSPADLAAAAYPNLAMLIVGLQPAPALGAWRIGAGEAVRLALIIDAGENTEEAAVALLPASPVTAGAVIAAAIAAVLFTVTIALTLLPPAPPIPGR